METVRIQERKRTSLLSWYNDFNETDQKMELLKAKEEKRHIKQNITFCVKFNKTSTKYLLLTTFNEINKKSKKGREI